MTKDYITYEEGYEYQVKVDCELMTPIKGFHAAMDFLELFPDGRLVLYKGFAWDGSSGVADTKSSQRASAGHDALFRLLRANLIPHDPCFHLSNVFYYEQCIKDGMWKWRAKLRLNGLEKLGNAHAKVQPDPAFIAP